MNPPNAIPIEAAPEAPDEYLQDAAADMQVDVPAPPAPPPPPAPALLAAGGGGHPAPDLADAVAAEDEPSYIYTPKGIYTMPHWYVDRDRNCPVWITHKSWRDMNNTHNMFTAASFLNNTSIRAENIVVISQLDPRDPHGRPWRCHWFVRLAIEGNSHHFEEPFGCNYLWQLPYAVCVEIIKEINMYAVQHHLMPHEVSPLARQLKPTTHAFNAKDWKDVHLVESVPSYYDCLFAMAVKPCRGPIPAPRENEIVLRKSLARHDILRTSKRSPLQFEGVNGSCLPDDMGHLIIDQAVSSWLPRSDRTSLRSLMNLRCLNKNFRDFVDRSAAQFLSEMEDSVRAGLKSRTPSGLIESRNCLLEHNMCVFSLCVEIGSNQAAGIGPSIYSLMRLRSFKPPTEMPPKPKPVVSAEELAKEQERFDRIANPGFIRRREKRRRIMAEARGEWPID